MKPEFARRTALTPALAGIVVLLLAAIGVWLGSRVPDADWSGTYYGVGRALLEGGSLYGQAGFLNPPWAALLAAPFALFPQPLGRGLLLVASLGSLLYIAWRLRAPKLAVIALLLSPTAIGSLLAANLDMLVMLGLFVPPAGGLLLLLIKPQIGVGPAAYYLVDSWQSRRLKGVLWTFAPVIVAYALSALVFPVWIARMLKQPADVWNRGLFPYGIPLGVLLLYFSIRFRNGFWALASTPFLAPYVTFPTYLVVQVGLLHADVERFVRRDLLQIGLCVILWILMLVFRL